MRCLYCLLFLAFILTIAVKAKPKQKKSEESNSESSKEENNVGVQGALNKALEKIESENEKYERRYGSGIDRLDEQFQSVSPALFEATPGPAVEIEKQSRLINWVSFILRKEGYQGTFSEALNKEKRAIKRALECPFKSPKSCPDESKYRSYDGVCNNKENPLRGAAFTPFPRDLPPAYEEDSSSIDEIDDQPRQTGRNGQPLPNARAVSRAIHQREPTSSNGISNIYTSSLFMAYGQFIAHDITDKVVPEGYKSSHIDCCNQDSIRTPQKECFNIDVPVGDPLATSCLGFARSLEVTDLNCEKGRREQLNAASSFIDASAVYGVNEEHANYLRTFAGGKLITSDPKQLPHGCPRNVDATKRGFGYAQAGDPRASEVSHLIGMHTVWLREHNRIAGELQNLTDWNDERLFQESRRIISAMIQHVTFNEWLPLLVGPDMISEYNLALLSSGHYDDYDPKVIPGTSNVVATAAMRFGHSLVPGNFGLYNKDYSQDSSPAPRLKDLYFQPNWYLMYENRLMRGLLVNPSQSTDPFLTNDLTNHLFEMAPGGGGDLAAFNIQRGRDHGLPSYKKWRESLGLATASTFDSLPNIPSSTATILADTYDHPDDIDLFVGGLSETPVQGGVVGPSFANLLARQFSRYRQGDRYWYETNEMPQKFSTAELTQIRGVTIAEVLCNTLDLDTIQPNAFQPPSTTNVRVPCSSIQEFDLSPFNH